MSANLPRRGDRREGRPPPRPQPSAMDTSAMDTSGAASAAVDADGDVRAGQLGGSPAAPAPSDTDRRRRRTQRALRSPRAVRQAILLREVLGPPVALRRRRADPPGLSE